MEPKTAQQVAQRHKEVSGSLALLYFLLGFHGGRQGSGPDRGQSPVEWLAGPQAWLDGPEGGNGRTDKRTNGRKISPFYRTLSPIGAAAQKGRKKEGRKPGKRQKEKKEEGKKEKTMERRKEKE